MNDECTVASCMKCALKEWCDHPLDTHFQELIAAFRQIGDPNFVVK